MRKNPARFFRVDAYGTGSAARGRYIVDIMTGERTFLVEVAGNI
jgi:hypothetical protein